MCKQAGQQMDGLWQPWLLDFSDSSNLKHSVLSIFKRKSFLLELFFSPCGKRGGERVGRHQPKILHAYQSLSAWIRAPVVSQISSMWKAEPLCVQSVAVTGQQSVCDIASQKGHWARHQRVGGPNSTTFHIGEITRNIINT